MALTGIIRPRLPLVTAFFAGLALLVYAVADLQGLLVYDRQAIQSGQLWRLATGCLVHFSTSHLIWDLLIFVAAGWAIQFKGCKGFAIVFYLSATVPSCYLFLFSPDLARFGGLSGPAISAMAYFCLWEVDGSDKNRLIWFGILVLIGLKIVVETTTRSPIFARGGEIDFQVLPSVHAISFAMAFAVYGIIRTTTRMKTRSGLI